MTRVLKARVALPFLVALLVLLALMARRFSAKWLRPRTSVELRWSKAYEKETWNDVRTGIAWSLSFLGAALPKGSLDRCIARRDDSRFLLDLTPAGFNPEALAALARIIGQLQQSDEYEKTGSIDLGRFLVMTLHSAWHYYAITGADPTLEAFLGRYHFNSVASFAVVKSGVARDQRVLRLKASEDPLSMAFLAEEGHGSTQDGTFKPQFYEAVAVLPNGQFRFAVYDRQGKLSAASPQEFGAAGRPSKCLWCHEIYVQGLVNPTPDVAGYLTVAQASSLIQGSNQAVNRYRQTLSSEIDFSKTQDHSYSEYLYETFMDPPVSRLASEWKLPLPEVLRRVQGLTTHKAVESPTPEPAYGRAEVDARGPYDGVRVPLSIREPSAYEPDFLR